MPIFFEESISSFHAFVHDLVTQWNLRAHHVTTKRFELLEVKQFGICITAESTVRTQVCRYSISLTRGGAPAAAGQRG